ncbi:MAG: PspC domain-containing protein [Sphingobacteriales bacterium]|nr:MAG: PspC domain-containing protein [Sphingobacteriales bacterium]
MEKIISINIAGRVMPIEEAAFNRLQTYFNELRAYFSRATDGDEILTDLESRLGELLSDRIMVGHPTLQLADVESAMTTLGRREDFEQQYGNASYSTSHPTPVHPEPGPQQPRTHFYRNTSDKVCGGVCSGIAHYLGLDPLLIRIVTVLLFFTGWGVLGYILVWIIAPEAPLEKRHSLRLYRNRTDKWLGGVCGGLASAFGKESWLFRLLFAVPVLFGIGNGTFNRVFGSLIITGTLSGTIIVVYLLLWMLLPLSKPGQEQARWSQPSGRS